MIRVLSTLLLLVAPGPLWAASCTLPEENLAIRPLQSEGPTEIRLRLYVNDIIAIHDADQSYIADVVFRAEWHDPRLAHSGAVPCSVRPGQIWDPVFQLLNRRSVDQIRPPELTVSPNGLVNFFLRSYGEYSFKADLSDFPFDRQELIFKVVSTYESEDVRIVSAPELFGLAEEISVPNWNVSVGNYHSGTFYVPPADKHLVRMDFVLQASRLTGFYTWQQLVPLFLVVMMTWIVFWIPREHVPSRIGLAATSMLTLIAYRFAMSSVLPPIAYLTRLDIFMIGASVLVFGALATAVAVTYTADLVDEELADRINRMARWLSPVGLFLIAAYAFFA
jgi:hypothetical protein